MTARLIVTFDQGSPSPLQIANAIGDDCELVFVSDLSKLTTPTTVRLLPRVGTVIDIADKTPEGIVAAVAATQPSGVVAYSDGGLLEAARIANACGLIGNRPDDVSGFCDKFLQRSLLQRAGVAVPRVVLIDTKTTTDLVGALRDMTFPAVLKPRNGHSSRDTSYVASRAELLELIDSSGATTMSGEQYVLEEYLADTTAQQDQVFGDYVSVESVVNDGNVRHLAITGKFPLESPYRETGNFLPSTFDAAEAEAIKVCAADAATALRVRFGCLHTEIKMTPSGPRVIELNARVAGGGIDDLFSSTYGESLIRIAALNVLGLSIPDELHKINNDVAYQFFVQAPQHAHELVRLNGLNAVSALPGVELVAANKEVGATLDWRLGSQHYICSVRGSTTSHEELIEIRRQALAALDIAYR